MNSVQQKQGRSLLAAQSRTSLWRKPGQRKIIGSKEIAILLSFLMIGTVIMSITIGFANYNQVEAIKQSLHEIHSENHDDYFQDSGNTSETNAATSTTADKLTTEENTTLTSSSSDAQCRLKTLPGIEAGSFCIEPFLGQQSTIMTVGVPGDLSLESYILSRLPADLLLIDSQFGDEDIDEHIRFQTNSGAFSRKTFHFAPAPVDSADDTSLEKVKEAYAVQHLALLRVRDMAFLPLLCSWRTQPVRSSGISAVEH
mmetsp:Transcript_3418/g.10370  ORF Transcript_3418/g.10370 Transcript_3418/m.10370 type:complete len:256 (+) Transcript_3418:1-768(+)